MDSVKLIRGHFFIETKGNATPDKIKHLMESWYVNKAACRFKESYDRNWQYFEKHSLSKPLIQIRRMQKRWGSLSKGGTLPENS